ncbi:DUF6790 family protein [Flavitalea sp.]|nr:DUF6790 family protein [Flavitalea sp.]
MNTKIQQPTKQREKFNVFYVIMNISLLCILPAASVTAEIVKEQIPIHWTIVAKWFIFWAAGIRLFTAGLKQAANPEFTAREIFRFTSKDSYVVIRELGFANIALGAMGILSVINEHWRLLAAITSCIFFGFAALQHYSKKPDTPNEFVALVYDTSVFIILLVFTIMAFPL